MKVVVAGFSQETNSFSRIITDRAIFNAHMPILKGDAILDWDISTNVELSGMLYQLRQYDNVEICPAIVAQSVSGGRVAKAVYDEVETALLDTIRANAPVDGVVLWLHGAMMCEHVDDAEGTLMEAIRQEVGPKAVIACTLDLHANITKKMADNANALVGYHTYPHVDLFEVGQKAAQIVVEAAREGITPVTAICKLPIVIMGEAYQTTHGPIHEVIEMAKEIEQKEDIYYATIHLMQPWFDTPEAGGAATVTAKTAEQAAAEVEKLGAYLWKRKEECIFRTYTMAEIAEIISQTDSPVVIGDAADGTGSGSAGDSTFVLLELVRNYPNIRACLTIADPIAVADAFEAGVGAVKTFRMGARAVPEMHEPAVLECRVRMLFDGDFIWQGPQHRGDIGHMGRTAVLRCGNVDIVLMENPAFNWDPGLYYAVGIRPQEMQLVLTKSPKAFHAPYSSITDHLYVVDAPGISPSNPLSIPFEKIAHPMYPYDDVSGLNPSDFVYVPSF